MGGYKARRCRAEWRLSFAEDGLRQGEQQIILLLDEFEGGMPEDLAEIQISLRDLRRQVRDAKAKYAGRGTNGRKK